MIQEVPDQFNRVRTTTTRSTRDLRIFNRLEMVRAHPVTLGATYQQQRRSTESKIAILNRTDN